MEYLKREKRPDAACVYCAAHQGVDDRAGLVLLRNEACCIVFNHYPYNSSHLLAVTHRHVGGRDALTAEESANVMHGAGIVD